MTSLIERWRKLAASWEAVAHRDFGDGGLPGRNLFRAAVYEDCANELQGKLPVKLYAAHYYTSTCDGDSLTIGMIGTDKATVELFISKNNARKRNYESKWELKELDNHEEFPL